MLYCRQRVNENIFENKLYQLKCLSNFVDFELKFLEIFASQMVSFFFGTPCTMKNGNEKSCFCIRTHKTLCQNYYKAFLEAYRESSFFKAILYRQSIIQVIHIVVRSNFVLDKITGFDDLTCDVSAHHI